MEDQEPIRKEDFKKALDELEESDKKEVKELETLLEKYSKKPNIRVENKEIKERIARICLKLINETPNDKVSIMETSYIITGYYTWCTYGDDLDKVVSIAGELEIPEEHVHGNVLKMWKEMKTKLEKYLNKIH